MLILEKYKLLFVSNPKTGTTMAQSLLLTLDDSAQLNRIPQSRQKDIGNVKLQEHMRSQEIKKKLGDSWDDYYSLVFVRNPYDKIISTYFFYKNGQPITRNDNKRKLQVYMNILLVKTLPFWVWLLVKKMRENHQYILDENDRIIVNHIGKNEKLVNDLNEILILYKINKTFESKERINVSNHENSQAYFKNNLAKRIFDWRYKKDVLIFEKLQNIDVTVNLKGKNIYSL